LKTHPKFFKTIFKRCLCVPKQEVATWSCYRTLGNVTLRTCIAALHAPTIKYK